MMVAVRKRATGALEKGGWGGEEMGGEEVGMEAVAVRVSKVRVVGMEVWTSGMVTMEGGMRVRTPRDAMAGVVE